MKVCFMDKWNYTRFATKIRPDTEIIQGPNVDYELTYIIEILLNLF